jgi:hypothetical protein
MAISAKVDNYGLQEALKKMQKLDPAMRRTLLKDTKVAAKPLVDAINARVPQAPPLSGMAHNGRTGWSKVKKVQISLNTRKPRKGSITAGAEQIAVVRVVTKGAPVAITDMAGKAGGTKLAQRTQISPTQFCERTRSHRHTFTVHVERY